MDRIECDIYLEVEYAETDVTLAERLKQYERNSDTIFNQTHNDAVHQL